MRPRINWSGTVRVTSVYGSLLLGEFVHIEVTTTDDIAITEFYLGDCTASNGLSGTDLKSLKLVTDGCMEYLGSNLDTDIAATMTGTELRFKQFAFADESKGKIAYNLNTKILFKRN